MKNVNTLIAALAVSVAPLAAFAGGDAVIKATSEVKAAADKNAAAAPMTEGEVKKVDKDGGKVTIKHGEIKNLDMPGMTMVFRVQDPAMLDQLKAGDKINFSADNVKGKLTVTKVEVAK